MGSKVPHDYQKIQGLEKEQMDNPFKSPPSAQNKAFKQALEEVFKKFKEKHETAHNVAPARGAL